MPPEEKYLTVSEFSKLANRSRKRIYDLMQSKLAPYCKVVDGKKMIAAAGLSIFDEVVKVTGKSCQGDNQICKGDSSEAVKVTKPETAVNTENQHSEAVKVTNESCKGDSPEVVKVTSEICQGDSQGDNTLAAVIEVLREQLAAKDRQIAQQGSQIADLTAALRTAQAQAENLTAALTAAQALHAGTLQRIGERAAQEPVRAQTTTAAASPPLRPSQGSRDAEPVRSSASPRSSQQHSAAPSGLKKKQGIFSRFFQRKKKN